jgi:large subunit ribosomal protein L9
MKVILLQDIANIGKKYDLKNVNDGYARNFLLPKKLAEMATVEAIKKLESEKKRKEQEREVQADLLKLNLEKLAETKIEIERRASEKGHLFDSLDPKDLSNVLKEKYQLDIPPEIMEIENPIKAIGEHKIKIDDKEIVLTVKPH